MKKLLLSIVTAALFLLPSGILADTGNYIVSIKDGEHISAAFEKKYNLTPLTTKDHGLYITDEENAEKIEENPKVEEITETDYYYLSLSPNDPYYTDGFQWGIDAVNAQYGWSLPKGKTSTVVVIDTGFDFSHEDKGNILPGKDIVAGIDPKTGQYNDTDHDYFTHGTACAGVIGAATDNGIGMAGLTDQCRVIVISVFKANSKGEAIAEDADIIAAIYSAIDDYNADVISMSFGGTENNIFMQEAVSYAEDHNAILVAAAGNGGTNGSDYEFPAAYDEVIGVANMDSSYRIDATSTKNESVYITAPGTNICTLTVHNSYQYFSGTSLATPFVAALAALAKAQDPSITPEEFKYFLRATSSDLGESGYDIASGYGLIDFEALLKAVTTDTKALSGSGTVQDPYLINDESDLRLFCLTVSGGKTEAAGRLNADIAVSPDFTGISVEYNGVFDGNGHKISGLNENLFDTIGSKGTVQNLTLRGEIDNDIYGGILATENYGTLINCHTEGTIKSETAGGLCGFHTGTILGCSNRATLRGANTAGIAAVVNGGTISQSYNLGEIRSNSGSAAGICCCLQDNAAIDRCYNAGKIVGTNSTGGIVNFIYESTVYNCFYAADTVTNGTSDNNICAKNADYMKTDGFIAMLNRGTDAFTTDSSNKNSGWPLWGSSGLTEYFTDVEVSLWYADPIYELTADDILHGRGNHIFDPEAIVTRAEFVTILAKTAGADLSAQKLTAPFKDVAADDWYAAAISWAYEQDLAEGKAADRFCPNDPVSREEISCFLMRFIRHYSAKELPTAGKMAFSDTDRVSDWAKEDTALLTTLGIINGFPDGTFRPQNSATRAQSAQMTRMMRLQL